MRLIDRLNLYLTRKGISAYAFERACGIGNGYLGKQSKGKGTVGSDILEKIAELYPELSLDWLITGQGKMIRRVRRINPGEFDQQLQEDEAVYKVRNKLIDVLKGQLEMLESSFPPGKTRRKSKEKPGD